MNGKRLFWGWLLFCLLISLYSYIGDCIVDFKRAIQQINFFFWYFFLHWVIHIYIIGPAVFIYFYLIVPKIKNLLTRIVIFILIAALIQYGLRGDDYNLTIGQYGDLKQAISYTLAAVTTVLVDEFYFKQRLSR